MKRMKHENAATNVNCNIVRMNPSNISNASIDSKEVPVTLTEKRRKGKGALMGGVAPGVDKEIKKRKKGQKVIFPAIYQQ